ncbi:hypothetical protein [Botrimarina sp.]|uniref:hypothetical protein n=1 Tax=Botrimarina sp. TaxID=2795802 RepID=UPI0032EF095A
MINRRRPAGAVPPMTRSQTPSPKACAARPRVRAGAARRGLPLTLLAVLCLAAATATAEAHSEHMRGFYDLYTKGPDADKDFRKLARKAKCNICHQGKKERTNYNRYGEELTLHLTEEDRKDEDKILAALKTIADTRSDPSDPAAPTFGELIARGELPGGPLEESQREPE